jgi:RNA polymerase sigma factor (sigma-70 family)
MTTRRADTLLSTIRGWANRAGAYEASDQELLERFIRSREPSAFAALVTRHGPRVLGVCRRVLRDEHAAEDAFQNVFLLLARKAGSIQKRTLLAGWLYGTACRTAAHARVDAARRRGREALAEAGRPSADPAVEAAAVELSAVLEEEVGRLSERYRSPIVLCHVERRTRDEAAHRLGCSPRTLQRRLERGRALLRVRLGRRGVTLAAALVAPALWGRPAAAAVSGRLATAAVQRVVAGASIATLSRLAGVTAARAVRTFLLTRPQVALGLLAVACLAGSGVGVACYGAGKQAPHAPPSPEAHRQAAAPDLPAKPPKGDAPMPIDPKLLAKLAEQLQSKNWDERPAALTALEKLVPEKGAGKMDFGPVIEPLFDNSGWGGIDEKDRHRAEELIVRIGEQTAPTLRRRLGSSSAHDRRVAAELVVRVESPSPGLTDLLRPLLADENPQVRRAAIQGLGAQGPTAKAAISDLEKVGADPDRINRVMACVALIHIAGPSEKRIGALADFLLLKKQYPDDCAAGYAAIELGKLGRQAHSAAPQLLAALKVPDVRYAAACALGPVGADPDKAVPALIAMLKDETEGGSRLSVVIVLGDFGRAAVSAVPAIREFLRSDERGGTSAAEAIGKIGGPDAVPALVEALQNKDFQTRWVAALWLGRLGGADASTIEALKKMQKDDPEEGNRRYAAEALKQIMARPSPETCPGSAKQAPKTPPSPEAHRQAAAPDLPAEPPKGDAPMPIDPKLLAKLAEQLRSQKWDESTTALTALEKLVPAKGAGKLDFGPVIEPLLDNCGWGGISEKDGYRAEELIVRIGEQAAPALRQRLHSSEDRDRRVAAKLVVRVEPSSTGLAELLRSLLADRDWEVRYAAIQGLGAQGPTAKAAISALEKEDADPNRICRVAACVALIHIAGPSEKRVGALADLLFLEKNGEDDAARYAADELSKLGRQAHSAVPQIMAALKYPNVRHAAANALGPVGADPDKAVPALLTMLKDEPDRAGRFAVAGALGAFGPAAASAVPILRKELRADGSSEDRGWVAAEAIGKIGGPDAVPTLVEALQNKDDQVRTVAIQWLAKLGAGDAAVIEALKKAQKDDAHPWNRKIAAEALKKLTAPPSPEH